MKRESVQRVEIVRHFPNVYSVAVVGLNGLKRIGIINRLSGRYAPKSFARQLELLVEWRPPLLTCDAQNPYSLLETARVPLATMDEVFPA